MSISRRGLLAIGLTAAVVGSIGAASMLNANADDGIDGGTAVAATSPAALEPGDLTTNDDGSTAIVPPTNALPWGARPTRMRTGDVGSSSAELAADGVTAARDDYSRRPEPEFGPKGKFLRDGKAITQQETTYEPGPVPPQPPAMRGDPVDTDQEVDYSYALGKQRTSGADGASANIAIGKPYLDTKDWHTLAEIAVQSADAQQTIEVGWTVDRSVNGDQDPHLFVFNWVNGVPRCYNACGYVPAKGASIKPGDTLASGVVRNFGVQHIGDAWWIALDTEWIGAFQDSNWDGDFTEVGQVQYYGEVAATSWTPCTQMGSAVTPDNLLKVGSRFSSINLVNAVDSPSLEVKSLPTLTVRDPQSTTGALLSFTYYPSLKQSDTLFRYGGKGVFPSGVVRSCSGNPPPS